MAARKASAVERTLDELIDRLESKKGQAALAKIAARIGMDPHLLAGGIYTLAGSFARGRRAFMIQSFANGHLAAFCVAKAESIAFSPKRTPK